MPGCETLAALGAAATAYPFERKLLVCRRAGVGRELLRRLAAVGVPWINWEVATPLQLAHSLIAGDLVRHGLRVADEFDELALLDEAIDAVLDGGRGRLAELAGGTGLRQAIASSVRALRQAGVGVAALERSRFRDEDKRGQIARILDEYERRLHGGGLVDGAALVGRAAASLAVGDAQLPGRVFLLPGQSARGLNGQLVSALLERGAVLLPADPVYGMSAPEGLLGGGPGATAGRWTSPLSWLHDPAGWSAAMAPPPGPDGCEPAGSDVVIDVFAATSVVAELREVLRRVMTAGLQWDEVEIVATDATAYGVALDGLARRLGIPVGYAAGLPVARTRPGRAVAKYLEWLAEGCPADLLRHMLERGDIGVRGPGAAGVAGEVGGMALARRLRSLRVGRGLGRYEEALQRAERGLAEAPAGAEVESPDEAAEQRARAAAEVAGLRQLLGPLLAATPRLPERPAGAAPAVSPAALATGVLALLDLVPATTALDRSVTRRLRTRLQRIAATAARAATLHGAVAVLMGKLDERVPAPEAEGAAPWVSSGGHLQLSDLEHGGWTGRRATFIVGLDAARFPGGGGSDALLVDDDRRRIAHAGAPALPTGVERLQERRHAFAALAARLRGRVTFSYATWDAVEGRAVAPSAELLQAYRLLSGDDTADYETLHRAVAPVASPVPRGSALLDADDVWLHALSVDGALRRGVDVVCGVYPHLGAGIAAWKARLRSPVATPHHGFIEPRPELDPRDRPDRAVSATQLQTLGSCPHRYLLRYVLRVRTPDDPDTAPERWLPPLERGALLHAVYEGALRRADADDLALDDVAWEAATLEILDRFIARYRALLPPPGEAVFELERERLREDVRAFVAMAREDGRRFIALERRFGPGHEDVRIALPDGSSLGLQGAIDRVDQLADGRLVVVDYKTGSSLRFGGQTGVFEGGRRLQHVLYAAAAERLFGRTVARAEYQFPSRRSENYRARYDRGRLVDDGLGLVTDLLDLVHNGWFLPTNVADDCRFCDYASVCRVQVDGYGKVASPLADWSRESQGPAADVLRRVRR